jgi:hypothetical protein
MALRSDGWAGAAVWERGIEVGLTLDDILDRSEVVAIGIDGGGLDDLLGILCPRNVVFLLFDFAGRVHGRPVRLLARRRGKFGQHCSRPTPRAGVTPSVLQCPAMPQPKPGDAARKINIARADQQAVTCGRSSKHRRRAV